MRMHADQVELEEPTVARIVADQFPRWRDHPVRKVASGGTVNALFRLGDEIVLRFPLRPTPDDTQLAAERDHALRLAGLVPLKVPEPVALGAPSELYPGAWSAYRWLPGEPASLDNVDDFHAFASDLAAFVRAVRGIETNGQRWCGIGRGGPLAPRDRDVRDALAASAHLVDTGPIERAWQRCLDTPHTADDTWIHADLMPGNLLVEDGRLTAVIDLETCVIGDPAVDLMPAWNLLPPSARTTYRRALGVDDATWERGRGWAIVQAIVALPYYVHTNETMAATARHTLAAVVT